MSSQFIPPYRIANILPWCLVFLCASFVGFSGSAHSDDYKLGTQDKLSIRILEWQVIEGTFREWSAIGGEYTVDASGFLSLPFVGNVVATGKTTSDISETIEQALQQKFGLTEKPEASVNITEHRPYFISGDIEQPGSYPYLPGLTVLKAITIAGGLPNALRRRTERELIDTRGLLDVLSNERTYLLARRARLLAEAKGDETIAPITGSNKHRKPDDILAEEQGIMSARRKKMDLRLGALSELKELLGLEIESMQQKIRTQNRQITLAQSELESVGLLAKKGLVVNSRVLSSERLMADLSGRLLDLETAILRAKQDISKATQDAINIRNTFETDVATERQEVEAKLTEINLKMRTQMDFAGETMAAAETQSLNGENIAEATYVIIRSADGGVEEISASEQTAIEPGDVIKVDLITSPFDVKALVEQN